MGWVGGLGRGGNEVLNEVLDSNGRVGGWRKGDGLLGWIGGWVGGWVGG